MEFLKKIEEKWQKRWEDAKIFEANPDPKKPKYFVTVAYPYPNSPQHIGHARTYSLADVHARYMRMRGYNVLFPMAFHYTGTPVLAMSKRLADKDKDLIDDFINVYKIPKERLNEFTDPLAMAKYFHQEIKGGMKEIGYSIDWRREFTTIDPQYNRFIEWQFQKLYKAGYITRGSHPVGWCPKDGNPVGQHDTAGDVEPEIGEFTLIKFRHNGYIFPAATLRPETVFGVTNIWLNPEAKYAKATVNGEAWIISQESVEKLKHLTRKVTVLEVFEGKTFIGKYAENPATMAKILILPADFVDTKNATGVVMSVPGHAPYDYVALEIVKKDASLLKEYGLSSEAVNSINALSVIEVAGYSAVPAGDVVKKMNIKDQSDSKLEDATKEVYRHEFHNGKMRQNAGKYFGLSVAEAKDKVKQDLISEGKATTMYELLNRPVRCRCGTECIVKIFQDQWFIDYGNPAWKALAHKNLEKMEIIPEEMRTEYNNIIDWLHEKACARKSGMGTRLPWDKDWIIESLSDSTIYMAYYTIAKHIKEHKIPPEQLTDETLDYVFLGIGSSEEIAEKTGLDAETLEKMRGEFLHFYPLDSRHSAHELIPNHLTFMIFNHTAIFPESLWPRQIATNGHVLMEGAKMSKSFGNIIPLREGLAKYGADPVRLSVLATAELLQDADFSPSVAKSMRDRVERLYKFAMEILKMRYPEKVSEKSMTAIDRWMLSRLQEHIRNATRSMDRLAVRKAIHTVLYELEQDFQWYQKRIANQKANAAKEGITAYVFNQILDVQLRMLAPFTPHICEEIWTLIGREGFISLNAWPTHDESKTDIEAEESESLIMDMVEDTQNIIRATSIAPRKICYYVAASWKTKAYLKILEKAKSGEVKLNEIMKEFAAEGDLKKRMKEVATFASKMVKDVSKMPEKRRENMLMIKALDEKEVVEDAKSFLMQRFNAQITVYNEEDEERYDPKNKAAVSVPYRPAIYIE
ncbi:leucine--tRNA ligase [Candidatus Bathyarchaeota archaeon]|nr:leucine--tRNA ligase [Candidatus Bathyarchaeota archaeon]